MHTILLLCVPVAVVVAGVLIVLTITHKNRQNDQYFRALSEQAQKYYESQTSALGVRYSAANLKKTCYNTEQGPWDNGRLWCGISADEEISLEPETYPIKYDEQLADIVRRARELVKSEGFDKVADPPSVMRNQAFSFRATKSIPPCTMEIRYEPDNSSTDRIGKVTYGLNCAARSTHIPKGFVQSQLHM